MADYDTIRAYREYAEAFVEVEECRQALFVLGRESRRVEIVGDDDLFVQAVERYREASQRFCRAQATLDEG